MVRATKARSGQCCLPSRAEAQCLGRSAAARRVTVAQRPGALERTQLYRKPHRPQSSHTGALTYSGATPRIQYRCHEAVAVSPRLLHVRSQTPAGVASSTKSNTPMSI